MGHLVGELAGVRHQFGAAAPSAGHPPGTIDDSSGGFNLDRPSLVTTFTVIAEVGDCDFHD